MYNREDSTYESSKELSISVAQRGLRRRMKMVIEKILKASRALALTYLGCESEDGKSHDKGGDVRNLNSIKH